MNERLKSKQVDEQLNRLTATERARIDRGEVMITDDNWKVCRTCYGSGEDQQGDRCLACKGLGETWIKKADTV